MSYANGRTLFLGTFAHFYTGYKVRGKPLLPKPNREKGFPYVIVRLILFHGD